MKRDRFDLWLKPLSPTRDLLQAYRKGAKTWEEFSAAFLSELEASPAAAEALRKLADLGRSKDVTLLCYEKAGLNCHRYIVRDILTKRRLFIKYSGAASAKS